MDTKEELTKKELTIEINNKIIDNLDDDKRTTPLEASESIHNEDIINETINILR